MNGIVRVVMRSYLPLFGIIAGVLAMATLAGFVILAIVFSSEFNVFADLSRLPFVIGALVPLALCLGALIGRWIWHAICHLREAQR